MCSTSQHRAWMIPRLRDYERATIIELKHRGHSLSIQRAFPVFYRGELIVNLIPDLIVDDAMIVDPKMAACFTGTHVAQNGWVSKYHRVGSRTRLACWSRRRGQRIFPLMFISSERERV